MVNVVILFFWLLFTNDTQNRRKLNANAGHYAWNILFTRIINLSFFVRRTQNSTITDQGKRKFEKKIDIKNPIIIRFILLHEKFLQFDWLRVVVFQLNLKYLHVKITNLFLGGIVRDIWHKYHSRYFKIVSNFTRLTAREIMYNNFEISLVVFVSNITANHAITYTNYVNIA